MSLRCVSALPTCLRGRQGNRHFSLQRSFSTCGPCSNVLTQSILSEYASESSFARPAETSKSTSKIPPQRLEQGYTVDARNGAAEQQSASNTAHNSRNDALRTAHTPTPAQRIGAPIEAPPFFRNSVDSSKPPGRARERDQAKYAGKDREFKKWRDLHGKFLEVRRKCPGQTAEVFHEQRKLAKRFIGDITWTAVSVLEFKCKWSALGRDEQTNLLPALLVGSLAESAAQTLFVLSNTGQIPNSFRVRMNCLRDVGIMYWKEIQQDKHLKATCENLVERLRSPEHWPKDKLPTVLLQVLLFWSTTEQSQQIINQFFAKYPDADASCMVAVIDHYIRVKDQEQALKYMKRLPENMLLQPNPVVKGLRDRLLKLDVVAKSEEGTNFKYLPQLLALGMPPDEDLHNTIIDSAISNGMPDVAWDLYQYLETSRFRTNSRSFLVLLRDSFKRRDLQRVNEVMTAIHHREDLTSDQYLMAYSMNIIRNINCYDRKLEPHEAHAHIMALYDRAYDRAPLCRLGIAKPLVGETKSSEPSPTLLAFTIWNFVLVQRRESEVLRLWEWIKHLISCADQSILNAARFDIIYNGLVLFHTRKSTGLTRALEIVQYMLSSKLCMPTPRTWSVLLCGFLKHRQTEQARRVLALMQREGYSVHLVNELYSTYVPAGYDLGSIADMISDNLDEKELPLGIEELLAGSRSLHGETAVFSQSI